MLDWIIALPDRMYENEGKIWLYLIGLITIMVGNGTFFLFMLFMFFALSMQHPPRKRQRIT